MPRKAISHPYHNDSIYLERYVWDELGWWQRYKLKRECYRKGGHWWHPIPNTLIDWFCCQCPAETDGMPHDGGRW